MVANHLLALLHSEATSERLDAAPAAMQSEREPEIRRCQSLQPAEQAQCDHCRLQYLVANAISITP